MSVTWITVAAYHITVCLLIRSGNPDCVYTEVIEITIFDRLCNTGKVAAVEGSSIINVRKNLTALVKTSVV